MKCTINIKNFTHEDLVDFFSTALYGSTTFYGHLLPRFAHLEEGGTCYEDKIANVLMKGGEFAVVDMEADGEINGPAKGVVAKIMEEGEVEYTFNLKHLENGLKMAFKDKDGGGFMSLVNLLMNDGTFDAVDADNLLQTIVFGEIVYG